MGRQVSWRLSCTTRRSRHPHFPFLSANPLQTKVIHELEERNWILNLQQNQVQLLLINLSDEITKVKPHLSKLLHSCECTSGIEG